MVIRIEPDLEHALNEQAMQVGLSPETLAVNALREKFIKQTSSIQPRDEWEAELLSIGTDCGVSLSNESLSRDAMYD